MNIWNLPLKKYTGNIIFLSFLLCLFTGWAVAEKTMTAKARISSDAELAQLKQDLDKLDTLVSQGLVGEASVLVGQEIRARDIYRRYLDKAASMSQELLRVNEKINTAGQDISLQQLGAICQKVSLANLRFKSTFQHGEDQFQSYQLIQEALSNLEAATEYWRVSNRYRKVYRGGAKEQMEDDEILRVRLLKAVNAIDELKTLMDTRAALSKNLEED
jgi:hypothetical protein